MDLSKVKLVVTDLDGTLLNPNHKISYLFFELFEKLKSHNILFVAASGRPLYGMLDKFSAIKEKIIIVAENGALAIKNDKVLLSTSFEKVNLIKIDTLLKTIPEANAVFCTKHSAYTNSKSKKLLSLLDEFYADYKVINSVEEIDVPIYKVALFHEISSEQYLYPHLKHLETNFKVKVSANHWVDISENNANKGYAIQLIQQLYNIKPEETMAFGDYNNDIEMLKSAYYSFAMENAHESVKSVANFSTKSNSEFGVESVLKKLIEAKEKFVEY